MSDAKDIAGIKTIVDPTLRPGVWQLRDGFGSVLWEWDTDRGTARTPCDKPSEASANPRSPVVR